MAARFTYSWAPSQPREISCFCLAPDYPQDLSAQGIPPEADKAREQQRVGCAKGNTLEVRVRGGTEGQTDAGSERSKGSYTGGQRAGQYRRAMQEQSRNSSLGSYTAGLSPRQ